VSHLSYAVLLVLIALATLPLELFLGTRVYARPRRLALTLVAVAVPFLAWDRYAVVQRHWTFDQEQTLGLTVAGLPVEEIGFFLVVPAAAVLTLEAVRRVKGWPVGDEP
jgi:lycopene cyclase domain-containing protein